MKFEKKAEKKTKSPFRSRNEADYKRLEKEQRYYNKIAKEFIREMSIPVMNKYEA